MRRLKAQVSHLFLPLSVYDGDAEVVGALYQIDHNEEHQNREGEE